MSKEWSFFDHVLKAIAKPRPGDPRSPTLWPSEATAEVINEYGEKEVLGKCRRSTFFRYVKAHTNYFVEEQDDWKELLAEIDEKYRSVDDYMRFIWAQGELYEEYLIAKAKETGVFITEQAPIYIRSHNISGKRDIEIINPETGKYVIAEAKSVYGYGANVVLGTDADRNPRRRDVTPKMGTPRDSNLMQIGIYHWWSASADSAYEESRLLYGARDNGRHGEYQIKTVHVGDSETYIYYRGIFPVETAWVQSPITIQNILSQYDYVMEHFHNKQIPARDFDLIYDEHRLKQEYERGNLNRTETKQYEKVIARREENAELVADGKKPKREYKQIEKGYFMCRFCSYQHLCYDKSDNPREL